MKVPFLRGRSRKTPRKVVKAVSSADVDAGILGDMASFNASQNVLPSTSLTRIICNDFSKEAAII